MLFKMNQLHGIKAGNVSLAFRKWKKPRAKQGSRIKTAVGLVEILGIEEIGVNEITEAEAQLAGHASLQDLLNIFSKFPEGKIYRIEVKYYSEDPRIALRNQTELTDDEYTTIRTKLARMDQYSPSGPWTLRVLQAVRQYPQMRAADLAEKIGKEKAWLKPNVRKLKNLGLTISHGVGYSLSPLGELIVEKLTQPN